MSVSIAVTVMPMPAIVVTMPVMAMGAVVVVMPISGMLLIAGPMTGAISMVPVGGERRR